MNTTTDPLPKPSDNSPANGGLASSDLFCPRCGSRELTIIPDKLGSQWFVFCAETDECFEHGAEVIGATREEAMINWQNDLAESRP